MLGEQNAARRASEERLLPFGGVMSETRFRFAKSDDGGSSPGATGARRAQ
jgi:hypothetical protein